MTRLFASRAAKNASQGLVATYAFCAFAYSRPEYSVGGGRDGARGGDGACAGDGALERDGAREEDGALDKKVVASCRILVIESPVRSG